MRLSRSTRMAFSAAAAIALVHEATSDEHRKARSRLVRTGGLRHWGSGYPTGI